MAPLPDARPPLDAVRLRQRATSVRPGGPAYDVEVVERTPSTNADVAARARAGAPEGLVVVAEHQTAGRGRLDRTWETPDRAALTLSALLRPDADAAAWTWLPLLAGVAVATALSDLGAGATLKWPNDVLVEGRKLGGLLVERVETPAGPAAVVGIGLNVSQTPDELPVAEATSLALAGVAVDRTELLSRVLARLAEEYDAWLRDPASVRAAYVGLCPTVRGQRVRVQLPGGEVLTGVGAGLSSEGGLLVRPDGADHPVTVTAGDVIHVRPAGE